MMNQWRQKRTFITQVVVGLGAVALLLVLARALPQIVFRAGLPMEVAQDGSLEVAPPPGLDPRWLDAFLLLLWGSFFISVLILLFSRDGRRYLRRSLAGSGLQLLYVVLFALVIVFAATRPQAEEPPADAGKPVEAVEITLEDVPLEEAAGEEVVAVEPPPWLTRPLAALFLAGVGIGLYLWQKRRRAQRAKRPLPLDELSRRAELAIDELRRGLKLDDVILRCYQEMVETAAAQRGARRPKGATPREFEPVLLRAGLPALAVQRLTRLFEQVRYGGYQPGPQDQQVAIASLTEIVQTCARLAAEAQAAQMEPQPATAVPPRRRWR